MNSEIKQENEKIKPEEPELSNLDTTEQKEKLESGDDKGEEAVSKERKRGLETGVESPDTSNKRTAISDSETNTQYDPNDYVHRNRQYPSFSYDKTVATLEAPPVKYTTNVQHKSYNGYQAPKPENEIYHPESYKFDTIGDPNNKYSALDYCVKDISIRCLLFSEEAGAIIGKGGGTIANIRNLTGCRITISDNKNKETERVLTCTGTTPNVGKVY